METTKLRNINIDNEMMDAAQIKDYVSQQVGGKEDIIESLKPRPLPKEYDYTAIEVYPTTEVIPAGTIDKDTGLQYIVEVPASSEHRMEIHCRLVDDGNGQYVFDKAKMDQYVDWGDGTVTKVSDAELNPGDTDETKDGIYKMNLAEPNDEDGPRIKIFFRHDYTQHITAKGQKFIVKIGGNVLQIRNNQTGYNIVSRLWEDDLPYSTTLIKCASWCGTSTLGTGSLKLLKIKTTKPYCFKKVKEFASVINRCNNLQAIDVKDNLIYPEGISISGMFSYNANLKKSNFTLSRFASRVDVYVECPKICINIDDILPDGNEFEPIDFSSTAQSAFQHFLPIMPTKIINNQLKADGTKKNAAYNIHYFNAGSSNYALRKLVPTVLGGLA